MGAILSLFLTGFQNIGNAFVMLFAYVASIGGYTLPDWLARLILILTIAGLVWGLRNTIPKLLFYLGALVAVCLILGYVPSPQLMDLINRVPI